MGAYFSSWKQAGVNHIYDLFYKGEFMTFDKIMSHFHITQKTFINIYKLDIMLVLGMVDSPSEITIIFWRNFIFVVQTLKNLYLNFIQC